MIMQALSDVSNAMHCLDSENKRFMGENYFTEKGVKQTDAVIMESWVQKGNSNAFGCCSYLMLDKAI